MVLGKLQVPGRPTILITVGQGPIALAVAPTASAIGPCPTVRRERIDERKNVQTTPTRTGWGWFGHFFSHLSFLFFLPLFGRRPDID